MSIIAHTFRKLNYYFISEDEDIHYSDLIWFYGMFSVIFLILLVVLI